MMQTTETAPEPKLIDLPRLVPLPDAQRAFGPSRSTFYRLGREGKLRLVKLGKGTFVDTDSALKFFASLPAA